MGAGMVRLSAGGKLRCFQSAGGWGGGRGGEKALRTKPTRLPDGSHLLTIQTGGRGRKLHIQLHLKNAVQRTHHWKVLNSKRERFKRA